MVFGLVQTTIGGVITLFSSGWVKRRDHELRQRDRQHGGQQRICERRNDDQRRILLELREAVVDVVMTGTDAYLSPMSVRIESSPSPTTMSAVVWTLISEGKDRVVSGESFPPHHGCTADTALSCPYPNSRSNSSRTIR